VGQLLKDPGKADALFDHQLVKGLAFTRTGTPSYLPAQVFSKALLETFKKGSDGVIDTAEEWKAFSKQLPPELQTTLNSVVGSASAKVDEAGKQIEAWFDSAMERLSGKYKRYTQRITLALAALLVVLTNADSISLTQKLWAQPALRVAATVLAEGHLEACKGQDQKRCLASAAQTAQELPIGWTTAELDRAASLDPWFLGSKFFGFLISVLAVSLGAPFWFDLIKRLSAMRKPAAAK
jgi:hypothetical protein